MGRSKSTGNQIRYAKRLPVAPKPIVILICEGKLTEEHYFKRIQEELGSKVTLKVECYGQAPKSLVDAAIARRDEDEDLNPSVWCVGDKDSWSNQMLNDQIYRANQNGIQYVLSNPCLELWFVLHYELYTREDTNDVLQARAKSWLPPYSTKQSAKALNPKQLDDLLSKTDTAITNAIALKGHNERATKPIPRCPETNLDELIAHLRSL